MTPTPAFRAYLDQAHDSLNGGDAQESERRAKAISALVRAERDVAEFLMELHAASEHDDEAVIRAELQRRLTLFADADRAGRAPEVLARIAATGSDF